MSQSHGHIESYLRFLATMDRGDEVVATLVASVPPELLLAAYEQATAAETDLSSSQC